MGSWSNLEKWFGKVVWVVRVISRIVWESGWVSLSNLEKWFGKVVWVIRVVWKKMVSKSCLGFWRCLRKRFETVVWVVGMVCRNPYF